MKKRYLLGFLTACLWCTGMLSAQTAVSDTLKFVFKLHGQTRRYQVVFCQQGENIQMNWGIERNSVCVTSECIAAVERKGKYGV